MEKKDYPTQEQWTVEAFDFLNDIKDLLMKRSTEANDLLQDRLNHLLNDYQVVKENQEEEQYSFDTQFNLIDTSMYHDLSTI